MQAKRFLQGCFIMGQIVQASVHSGTPRTQLLSIQYLRAIAALSVLVTHALQWPLPEMNMYLLKTGRLGVEVFFVISGFIITTIAGDGPFHPRVFLERRAHRIIPTYWAATLLTAALAIALPNQFRTTVPTLEGLLKSMLFIPSLEPKAPLLLLGWTLNFEVFFYLMFASLFFLRSGARTVVLLVCFALLVSIGQFGTGLTYVEAIYTSPSLIGFCLGTILAQAYRLGWITRLSEYLRWPVVAAPFCLLLAFYVIDWDSADSIALWKHLLMSFCALSIGLLALHCETKNQVADLGWLQYLGDASYSFYLFHIFAVAGIWAIGKRMFEVQHPLIYAMGTTTAILAGLVLGLLCHHFIERPLLAVGTTRSRTVRAT
jgi:exopolysaccharide production protein ExoZ